MALELVNFYHEPAGEHYGIKLGASALEYYHFVFSLNAERADGIAVLIHIVEQLARPEEILLFDYHYTLRRRELEKFCNANRLRFSRVKDRLSVLLPTPSALLAFTDIVKNEDDLFLRFVERTHAVYLLKTPLQPSQENYLSVASETMHAVAFFSLAPLDLEFVTDDRTHEQIQSIAEAFL